MKRRILGALAILAVSAGVVGYKWLSKSGATPAARPMPAAWSSPAAAAPAPVKAAWAAYLFADPREADCADGCSRLFHLVRAAAARGVSVKEVDPVREPALVKRYQVRVQPTFLVVDPRGRVTIRREGAAAPVIRAVREDLDRLASAK